MHEFDFMAASKEARALARRIWAQRFAGIVLGALAGAAAPYAFDHPTPAIKDTGAVFDLGKYVPEAHEAAGQVTHTLLLRARELITRGRLREAERFLAAAEQLEPQSQPLLDLRRLLDLAKARIELADKAPAAGDPPQERKEGALDANGTERDFAAGRQHFEGRNYGVAFAAFGRAAASGHAAAQNYLGYMYRHGLGVERDFARALDWYGKAAQQGHAGALNNIGYMHLQGLGVERSPAAARIWFRRAAERGDAAGQYNLAEMLVEGAGGMADYAEADRWFRAAIAQGHGRAALGLGQMLARGQGVPPNPAEAYFWFGVAARNGVEGAQRQRSLVGRRLTLEQRQEADRVAIWKGPDAKTARP
jgi:TPR repeat protein